MRASTVDLETQTVSAPGGRNYPFTAPETFRQMLLQGVDEIDLTLSRAESWMRFGIGIAQSGRGRY
jgi:3-isopropylmalate dehydratase small subunit